MPRSELTLALDALQTVVEEFTYKGDEVYDSGVLPSLATAMLLLEKHKRFKVEHIETSILRVRGKFLIVDKMAEGCE